METNMNSLELNKILILEFSNLKSAYIEEVEWQEGDNTGSHTVYGDIFVPYFRECILSKNANEITKIAKFLENLLEKKDNYADEVITFSVLESIMDLINLDEKLILFFGDNTKKIILELNSIYE